MKTNIEKKKRKKKENYPEVVRKHMCEREKEKEKENLFRSFSGSL